jgi:hypothetical protein
LAEIGDFRVEVARTKAWGLAELRREKTAQLRPAVPLRVGTPNNWRIRLEVHAKITLPKQKRQPVAAVFGIPPWL